MTLVDVAVIGGDGGVVVCVIAGIGSVVGVGDINGIIDFAGFASVSVTGIAVSGIVVVVLMVLVFLVLVLFVLLLLVLVLLVVDDNCTGMSNMGGPPPHSGPKSWCTVP